MDEWTMDLLKDFRDVLFGALVSRGLQDPGIEIEAKKAQALYKRVEGAIGRERERRIKRELAGKYAADDKRRAARERVLKKVDGE